MEAVPYLLPSRSISGSIDDISLPLLVHTRTYRKLEFALKLSLLNILPRKGPQSVFDVAGERCSP